MLLFVVIIYDPNCILITSVEEDFYLFLPPNQIFSVSGKLSPHNVEMPSISPLQACPSVVGVPTIPFNPSPKDAFSGSFVAEVGIVFYIRLSQLSLLYSFVPEALWCCSLQPIFLFCQDRVLFVLILLTGVSCLLFEFFPFCQVLPPFSTRVLSEIFLTHCAILSIVPEAMCC